MGKANLDAMSLINGKESPGAEQRDGFLKDRRRPGRLETGNAALIALMRGATDGQPAQGSAQNPAAPKRAGRMLLWVTLGATVFWAIVGVVMTYR